MIGEDRPTVVTIQIGSRHDELAFGVAAFFIAGFLAVSAALSIFDPPGPPLAQNNVIGRLLAMGRVLICGTVAIGSFIIWLTGLFCLFKPTKPAALHFFDDRIEFFPGCPGVIGFDPSNEFKAFRGPRSLLAISELPIYLWHLMTLRTDRQVIFRTAECIGKFETCDPESAIVISTSEDSIDIPKWIPTKFHRSIFEAIETWSAGDRNSGLIVRSKHSSHRESRLGIPSRHRSAIMISIRDLSHRTLHLRK